MEKLITFKTINFEYKLNKDKVIAIGLQNGVITFITSVGRFVCAGVRDAEAVFEKIKNVYGFYCIGVKEYEECRNDYDDKYKYRNQCDSIEFIPCTNMPVVNNDFRNGRRC